jgi:hypothetical protein
MWCRDSRPVILGIGLHCRYLEKLVVEEIRWLAIFLLLGNLVSCHHRNTDTFMHTMQVEEDLVAALLCTNNQGLSEEAERGDRVDCKFIRKQ